MVNTSRLLRGLRRLPEILRAIGVFRQPLLAAKIYAGIAPASRANELALRDGTPLRLETWHDLATAWILFCRSEYVVPRAAKVVIDIGANVGLFSLVACRTAPNCRVVAVEPFPATLAKLRANLAAWGLEGRVTVLPVAISDVDGTAWMDAEDVASQSRGIVAAGDARGVEVEACSLKTVVDRARAGAAVDLLKIDIEGSEHLAFSTATRADLADVHAIQMEYHPGRPEAELVARLKECGFRETLNHRVGPDSGTAHFARASA